MSLFAKDNIFSAAGGAVSSASQPQSNNGFFANLDLDNVIEGVLNISNAASDIYGQWAGSNGNITTTTNTATNNTVPLNNGSNTTAAGFGGNWLLPTAIAIGAGLILKKVL